MSDPVDVNPRRGDIWLVELDPVRGSEIRKTRPVAVVSVNGASSLRIRLCVPLTSWDKCFETSHFHIRVKPSPQNGLKYISAAAVLQLRTLSVDRFLEKLGTLAGDELEEIAATIAIAVGHA